VGDKDLDNSREAETEDQRPEHLPEHVEGGLERSAQGGQDVDFDYFPQPISKTVGISLMLVPTLSSSGSRLRMRRA
jgi:hypothetical protein